MVTDMKCLHHLWCWQHKIRLITEGTYALPEAQLDRFLFKINVDYPSLEEEVLIIQSHNDRKGALPQTMVKEVLSEKDLAEYRSKIFEILVEEKNCKIYC